MVVLITGPSKGIGAALTAELTGSGHSVLMVSRNRKQMEEIAASCNRKTGKELAHPIPFDLTDLGDLEEEFVSRIRTHTSCLDGLVNNAGHLFRKAFSDVTLEEARHLLEVNFLMPAQLIRICLPFMESSTLKHVVNISSMAGFQGSSKYAGLTYYSASKAALASLTECLAVELKPSGVRINALALGSVQTEMFAEAFPGMKAPLEPAEMASFIQWFILDGGRYFHGKVLPVSVTTP